MVKQISLPLLALVLFSCSPVSAESIYAGGWSKHIVEDTDKYEYNGVHHLMAYENNGYVVGHFINSYYRNTWLGGKRFDVTSYGDFDIKLHAGITYGYRSCRAYKDVELEDGPTLVCPFLAPEISYTKYERVRPALVILGNVLVVTFNISFDSW